MADRRTAVQHLMRYPCPRSTNAHMTASHLVFAEACRRIKRHHVRERVSNCPAGLMSIRGRRHPGQHWCPRAKPDASSLPRMCWPLYGDGCSQARRRQRRRSSLDAAPTFHGGLRCSVAGDIDIELGPRGRRDGQAATVGSPRGRPLCGTKGLRTCRCGDNPVTFRHRRHRRANHPFVQATFAPSAVSAFGEPSPSAGR